MLGKFVFQRSQNSCFLLTVSLPRSAVKIESSQKFTVPAVAIKNTHRNDPPCNIFAEYYKKFCSFFINDMARHAPPCLCGKSLRFLLEWEILLEGVGICKKVEYFRKYDETGVLIIKVSLVKKLI